MENNIGLAKGVILMGKNLYKEFDDILVSNHKMMEYTEKNINILRKNVLENVFVKKYGFDSLYKGYFCPSLILDKITSGFKKGRLLNNIPKGKDDYSIYEIDNNNKLLRIQEINSYGTIFEHYNFIMDGIEYCIGILENKKCSSIYNTRTIYSNGKVKQFDIINSNSLWSEQYEYMKDKIICKQYYYVPGLKGSNKSIEIGEEGSPVKLYIINFNMNEKNKIIWLEHGEYNNGTIEIDYEYKK